MHLAAATTVTKVISAARLGLRLRAGEVLACASAEAVLLIVPVVQGGL